MDKSYISYSRTYEYQKPYIQRYQQINKERLSLERKEKITCGCGSIITLSSIYSHLDTRKHQKFIASTEIPLL